MRSPLTRARLNTELLPETDDTLPQRQALQRDLGEMGKLITDLLESERLSGPRAGLHREPTDLPALALEGGRLRLTVRDHGPGVPEDVIPQLGQPFYRPDSSRTRHAGGVGLGLNLCRLVAQAHGGTLRIRNAQPGLEVVVELPG